MSTSLLRLHLLPFRVAVEVIGPYIFAEHHIIVEVNKLLGEPRDSMDVGLDGRRAEGGKVGVVQENILGKINYKNSLITT